MDNTHLKNLTIINTRPAQQAQALSSLVELAGGCSIELPCIEIKSVDDTKDIQNCMQAKDSYDYIIFVSANAVFSAMPYWVGGCSARLIAIGPATAAALQQFSIQPDLVPAYFSSEGILELAALQEVVDKRILILCGENPRTLLSDRLLKRRAQVDTVFCYRRAKPAIKSQQFTSLDRDSIGVIVTTSLDVLVNLNSLIQEFSQQWLYTKCLLVVSHKMLDFAENIPWQAQIIRSEADTESIIKKLMTWQQG